MLFAYISQKANIILMDTNIAELEKLVGELLDGIRRVAHPSNIKKVVLEVKDLDEMKCYVDVLNELKTRLDESLEYPVFIMERGRDKPAEGEYVIKVRDYLAQGKRSGLASLGNPVDASLKCDGKNE